MKEMKKEGRGFGKRGEEEERVGKRESRKKVEEGKGLVKIGKEIGLRRSWKEKIRKNGKSKGLGLERERG